MFREGKTEHSVASCPLRSGLRLLESLFFVLSIVSHLCKRASTLGVGPTVAENIPETFESLDGAAQLCAADLPAAGRGEMSAWETGAEGSGGVGPGEATGKDTRQTLAFLALGPGNTSPPPPESLTWSTPETCVPDSILIK